MNRRYLHRVYNLNSKKFYTTGSIKDFGRKENFDFELDTQDNWFYQNLENMTQSEYLNSNDKFRLVFEYKNYVLTRIG